MVIFSFFLSPFILEPLHASKMIPIIVNDYVKLNLRGPSIVINIMMIKHILGWILEMNVKFIILYLYLLDIITMAMFFLWRPSLFLQDLPATFRRHDVMGITAAIKTSSTLLNLLQLKGRTLNKLYTRRTFKTSVWPGSLCLMIYASNYPLISLKY